MPKTHNAAMPGDSVRRDIQQDIINSLRSNDFSAVETSFKYPNAGLIIGDKSGIRFETTNGWIGLDTNYGAIASQTKIVTTTVITRIAARKDNTLSLDSNPRDFFPDIWPDDGHNLTLAHLMSFTTGFTKDMSFTTGFKNAGCARESAPDQPEWKACIEQIANIPRPFEPGTSYLYGPWHLVVAAGMAQAAVGRPLTSSGWAETMRVEFYEPAGISKEGDDYPGIPPVGKGTFPDFGAGFAMNARSTSKFMYALYFGGKFLNSQSLVEFDKDRTLKLTHPHPPYPILFNGHNVGHLIGGWHYAFGHWIACDVSQGKGSVIREQKCRAENKDGPRILHSVGAMGWMAWIDHEHQYYGVFAANYVVDLYRRLLIMLTVVVVVMILWSYWVTNRCGKLKDQEKNANSNAKEASVELLDPQGIQSQERYIPPAL